MKMIKQISIAVAIMTLTGCSDSWLEPKPLSFYTPENTYVDFAGIQSALESCEVQMRNEYFGDGAPILTDMMQSDLAVEGTTDKAGPQMDMDITLLPDASLDNMNTTRVGWYWNGGFNGIKYANSIISRINNVTFKNETEKNEILGAAYFHRAYWYFKLVHYFGDVPFIDKEIDSPKYDFNTNDRWSILERIKKEVGFAYQWVPEKVDRGRTTKAACGMLLMKINMALGNFEEAVTIGKELVVKYPLMRDRFTANKTKKRTNLMHDLHSIEAKLDMSNTEGMMYAVSYPNFKGSAKIYTMRNGVPFWNSPIITTPDGKRGTDWRGGVDEDDSEMNLNESYGRGIGRLRPTNYYQYTIWTDKEKNDLRGIFNRDSWRSVSDLKYNDPNLKSNGDPWYGKNIVKPAGMSVADTIRCWFQWPHYKMFVPEVNPDFGEWRGGETPWYIYRSAETWLMLAECYYWLDRPAEAAAALNEVRSRSGADLLSASDVNMGAVLDERARELYYEESRHLELVRISYTYAKTGKPCEIFGGRVYMMDKFCGSGAEGVKDSGYNFWFDWVMAKNNFYNKGVVTKFAEYKMSVHHVLWPIPASAIEANVQGVINQNIGYPGAENRITPLEIPLEGPVLE